MGVRILAIVWCGLLTLAERKRPGVLFGLLFAALSIAGAAQADCAGETVASVTEAFANAQAFERSGDAPRALDAYARAQAYTCSENPVELDAARRAAELARPLAEAAERAGDLERAFAYWEAGGHFAAADRVLVKLVRSRPDDSALYDRALSHFANRALPAFASNMRVRLSVTGPYSVDPAVAAMLEELPAERAGRALADEADRFDESYLREIVTLEGRKAAAGDPASLQAVAVAHQQLAARWPEDPLAASRKSLRLAREWAQRDRDESRARGFETRIAARYADRAKLLVEGYSAAPSLLAAAMDYYHESVADAALVEPDLRRVQTQAKRLGDQSASAGRYLAAADYYDVAGDDAAAQNARDQQSHAARAAMMPAMQAAQQQALEMARAFGTPEQVKALEQQIAEATRAYEQSSANGG
ncbi:MAG TPA: hypothetical protein VLT59_01135 [Steroidobacteraceae bacterium]|nr:hypothetical protein [Steroidobacteraceae bacterium]